MPVLRRPAFFTAAAIVCTAPAAYARGTARLAYVRPAADPRCPDEPALRSMVATQLGYDPFDDASSTRVEASIERSAGRLRGRVVVRREREEPGERVLDASNDCASLATALALTLAVAIDTLDTSRALPPLPPPSPPPPPPAPPTVAPPRAETPVAPTTTSEPSAPISLRLSVAPTVSVGIAPAVAPGAAASVGARWGIASLDLEGRFDLPASASLSNGGEVSTSAMLGMLVPCVHLRWFVGCAVGAVGSMRGESRDVQNPSSDSGLVGAAGGRAGLEIPMSGTFALRPQVDVLANVGTPALRFNDRTIWTTPAVSGTFGVALVAQIGGARF